MRPTYSELPNGSARDIFGAQDQLGCLNLLTPERTTAAAALIRTGLSIGLNGSLKDWPNPNPFGRRAPVHQILRYDGPGRDDYYDDFYPQMGSQWDHFLHIGDPESGTFYNGVDESVGIAAWARTGIVGRAVLLDVATWATRTGKQLDYRMRSEISVADLECCAVAQNTSVEEGTILLVRVGWEEGYKRLSQEEREDFASSPLAHPGLEASREMAARLWDWGVAAVASDNPALEAWPPPTNDWLHHYLLGRLGIPIGEFWLLDELAAACASEDRFEFFLASAPLNCPGGVGSTANAVAVL